MKSHFFLSQLYTLYMEVSVKIKCRLSFQIPDHFSLSWRLTWFLLIFYTHPRHPLPQFCWLSLSVLCFFSLLLDLMRASLVAKLVKNRSAMRETWVQSLGWEDPLEKGPGEYHLQYSGLKNSMGYSIAFQRATCIMKHSQCLGERSMFQFGAISLAWKSNFIRNSFYITDASTSLFWSSALFFLQKKREMTSLFIFTSRFMNVYLNNSWPYC